MNNYKKCDKCHEWHWTNSECVPEYLVYFDELHSYLTKNTISQMIEKLKKLGFEIGTLQNVTGSVLNTKEKIIYKRIPHYEKAFVYAYFNDLDTFFLGDSRDSEFFTVSISSIKQIKDLLKSLDYEKYL